MDIKNFLTTNNAPGNCDDRQSGNPPLVQMNNGDDVTMDDNANGCAFDQNVSNDHPYNNYQVSYQVIISLFIN